ncbi:MAG: hypothetical protein BAJALOKI2v1_540018 [Promethearchaeota archaeon]|nr:MAG: hypothetical protein BAJALOKI2v1_540018 [Candidatus Lokiarchaeota archaeon]
MSAKIICFLAVAIGFFAFYQQNQIFTIAIIFIMIIGYVAYKRKKNGKTKSSLLSRNGGKGESYDQLVSFLMVQQFLNHDEKDSRNSNSNNSNARKEEDTEDLDEGFNIKEMILDLLRET